MTNQYEYGCPAFVLFVFLGIGITTFIGGCNSAVQDQCPMWSVFRGTVYNTEIMNTTCYECIQTSKLKSRGHTNSCTKYSNYTCYNAYIWSSDSQNASCHIQVAYHVLNVSGYANQMNDGTTVVWYKNVLDENDENCVVGNDIVSMWISGIIFMCLSICPLFWLCMTCLGRNHKVYSTELIV